MTQEVQVAPVATNTPFEYSQNMVISIGVSDLDRAIEWYKDALGLELVYKLDQYGWCEMSTATKHVTIGLGQNEDLKTGGATPTFGVLDIDAARKHLESKDVRFDGDTYEIEGMVKLATFYDPDGNSFMLAQSLSDEIPS
ncbi:MAG TPA: VOC family protein [Gaiellaceae bacterium]|nr:VOC family protein [Gaiellaceae bacterium]